MFWGRYYKRIPAASTSEKHNPTTRIIKNFKKRIKKASEKNPKAS